jgi:hypothetical protein
MRAELYWIADAPRGRLAIMPRPRAGDWLADELRSWQSSGVDVLVSLLTVDEIDDLGLQSEPTLCRDIGLEFISYPIADRGVPESSETLVALVNQLVTPLTSCPPPQSPIAIALGGWCGR